ncbi:hypothetical protein BDP27DRAFT_1297207 [Rhodocollybia butyracea]|uniref:Uncharacterized protein n=1 Tax=Rhodocollybia butyracea TaxID=206335 RepID=A0A9P5PJ17_9AGAR|nr:hypothetical protein BDP27DRAFT_1297207 [Rhodocollybia butyracea]
MTAVSFLHANFAVLPIVSLLYGAFVVLFVTSMSIGVYRHSRRDTQLPRGNKKAVRRARLNFLKRPLSMGSMAVFCIITVHFINSFTRFFDAVVNFEGGKAPLLYYNDLSRPSNLLRNGSLLASLILCDVMIIYRVYVIWGYNIVVIIPSILSLTGFTVCAIGGTYEFSRFEPGMNIFVSMAKHWVDGDAFFTLATNLYSTVMIAWRIWSVNRGIKNLSNNRNSLMRVLSIFVESAAIYTSWALMFIIIYASGSNLQYPAVDMGPSIAGISFMLINLRIGLGWAQQATNHTLGVGSWAVARRSARYQLEPIDFRNSNSTVESVIVNVTRITENNRGFIENEYRENSNESA